METTLTAALIPHAPHAAAAPGVLALALLWSREEPARIGEVALFPAGGDGRPRVIGRAGGRKDLRPAEWVQQRPGRNLSAGPLTSPRISRDQLLVQVLADRRLALTNVGRLGLKIRGEAAPDGGVAALGDLIELDGEVLLLVCERPPILPVGTHDDAALHPFGAADADGLVGESPAAWELREQVAFVAGRAVHTLIRGESGTGKELVAQALHLRSARGKRPLVARNAATIPETLIDAELFGNAKNFPQSGMPERPGLIGEANGSTLFLDEFAELPQAMQAHLLRVLDHGEYQRLGESRATRADLRLIAATNRPEEVLKHDVLARLKLRIVVPGLNERREDIPLLARRLIQQIAAGDPEIARRLAAGDDPRGRFTLRLIAALVTRAYTTHVRELEGLLWQAITRSRVGALDTWEGMTVAWSAAPSRAGASVASAIETADGEPAGVGVAAPMGVAAGAPAPAPVAAAPPPARAPKVDPLSIPAEVIQACLDRHSGRQEPVWRELGLTSRHVLTRLVKRHGLAVAGRGRGE